MRVGQARETARQWVNEEASRIPGFCGAYTIGSTNWLPDDANLMTTSDLDIMVVLTDPYQASSCDKLRCAGLSSGKLSSGKFRYGETLLEVSYLRSDQLQSSDLVLSDYHLAPRAWSLSSAATIGQRCSGSPSPIPDVRRCSRATRQANCRRASAKAIAIW
jgi:hypothetical protein